MAIRLYREEDDMKWQAPHFIEIDMNAEIGAYQRDPLQDPGSERRARAGDEAGVEPSRQDPERRVPSQRT